MPNVKIKCAVCGKSYMGHHSSKYCSEDCKKSRSIGTLRKIARAEIQEQKKKQQAEQKARYKAEREAEIMRQIEDMEAREAEEAARQAEIDALDAIEVNKDPTPRIKVERDRSKRPRRIINQEAREAARQRIEESQTVTTPAEEDLKRQLAELEIEKKELQDKVRVIDSQIAILHAKLGQAGFSRNCFGISWDQNDDECMSRCVKREECMKICVEAYKKRRGLGIPTKSHRP